MTGPALPSHVARVIRRAGIARARDLERAGISRTGIRRLCERGLLERVGRQFSLHHLAIEDAFKAHLKNGEVERADAAMRNFIARFPPESLRPGDVITTLDDVSLIKLDLMVPETAVALLKTGMLVEVKSAAFGARLFPGNVTGIDSRVDPVARTILVRVEVPNDEGLIKPGMLLSASLRADPRNGLSVPEEAIVPLADKRFVFVVRQGEKGMIAERRPVRTGRRVAGSVEILEGLVRADQVVT